MLNTTTGTSSTKLPLTISTPFTFIFTVPFMCILSGTSITSRTDSRFTTPRTKSFIFLLLTTTTVRIIAFIDEKLKSRTITTITSLHVYIVTGTKFTTSATISPITTIMKQTIRSSAIIKIPCGELTFLSTSQESKCVWLTKSSMTPGTRS